MRSAIEASEQWDVMCAFEAAVASAAGVRNAADAALVDLVVTALAEGWWEGWKIHTPVQWLMWQAGLSRSTARQVIRLARRADDLPTVMAAFRAGGLSLDQAATVARYVPAAYEASVTFPRFSGRGGCGDHAAVAAGVWACS